MEATAEMWGVTCAICKTEATTKQKINNVKFLKIEIKTAVSFLFWYFVENCRQKAFKQTKDLIILHNQFNYLISCVFMFLLLFT